jgi:hypothetical protein
MTEVIEDAADHLVGPALATEQLELIHHAIERELDAGNGVVGITVTLPIEPDVTTPKFLAVKLREQGHTKQGVHDISGVSERQLPL